MGWTAPRAASTRQDGVTGITMMGWRPVCTPGRKAQYRDPQSAPDFRDRNRSAPRRNAASVAKPVIERSARREGSESAKATGQAELGNSHPVAVMALFLCVTPGLDSGARTATVAGRRRRRILDARVNPRIKSGDAHDASQPARQRVERAFDTRADDAVDGETLRRVPADSGLDGAPRRCTPSRRPLGSMTFRSLDAVNDRLRRPPSAARPVGRVIDSVQTSEKRGFHGADGAPRRNAASVAKPPSWKSPTRREGAKAPQRPGRPNLGRRILAP